MIAGWACTESKNTWSTGIGLVRSSFLPTVLSGDAFAVWLCLHLLLELLIVVLGSPEQKDVWLRRMNLVMNPSQALLDTDSPPFLIRKKAKSTGFIVIEVILRNEFEERFWEDHMSVLVLVV